MANKLTDADIELLKEAQIAIVTTVNPDGSLHSTPTWVDTDGEAVIINTSVGRKKPRNIEQFKHVSICVVDSKQPYRWVSVSGKGEFETKEADAHIDAMAKKYLGQDTYPFRTEGEVRVMVRVVPTKRLGS